MTFKGFLWQSLFYVRHCFSAVNTKGHGVHSPALFGFVNYVIHEKNSYYSFQEIEKIRNRLLKSEEVLHVDDFGTGNSSERLVSDIARKSLKNPKSAQLLYRISKYLNANTIVELGTSLGISTSYLAMASKSAKCVTLEGSSELCKMAQNNFLELKLEQISVVEGNIDDNLPLVLSDIEKLDLVFFDANHTKEATLRYFDLCLKKKHRNSIFIFDDIYWTPSMTAAWKTIKQNSELSATIDLFEMGIVFFNPDFLMKHYRVKF